MVDGMVCGVCGRVLDEVEGVGWRHTILDSPEDHPAVPVPRGSVPVRERCDFCSAEESTFVLPARDFPWPGLPGRWSHGEWAACGTCGPLIQRNEWGALIRRVAGIMAAPPHMVQNMRRLYADLRKNITGSIRPI